MIEGHMDTKELKQKICKEYGVRPSAVSIYQNDNGTFVQMYNAQAKQVTAVSEKDIAEINNLIDGGEPVFNAFSNHFQKNSRILELATDYILGGGNMMSLKGICDYVNKNFSKQNQSQNVESEDDFAILKKYGKIEGYVVKDEKLVGPVFNSTIFVEKIGYKNTQTRCFVDEIETQSESRGKGFASHMLEKFLPLLCANSDISSIVLQAGSFDVEKESQTQTHLEKFYKKCGFSEVQAGDEFNCIKPSDFDQGYSVFVKSVDCDRYFE